ncbi:MAG: type II toxin-antitoxin system Phd/YefM family antitoxin [Spirochaetota bacterium]|nr:type II toxin-antitoxin system Phd/YefM family antitoxin [Spirochaetota bacterium]
MKTLQVSEFKKNFSEVLKKVRQGEEVAVSFGKHKEKIAVLIPYSSYKKKHKRKIGILENKASFKLTDNFEISEEEFLNS